MNPPVYMDGSEGPFRCDNCEYFTGQGECTQTNIISFAKKKQFDLSLLPNGNAKVDPAGCSNFYEPKSGNEENEDSGESNESSDNDNNESPVKMDAGLPVRRPTSKLNFQ